jgi:hypothetical protein
VAIQTDEARSGEYTPNPLVYISNVDVPTVTYGTFYWSRVGNIVTVAGGFQVANISGSGSWSAALPLPIPATIGVSRCYGIVMGDSNSGPLLQYNANGTITPYAGGTHFRMDVKIGTTQGAGYIAHFMYSLV